MNRRLNGWGKARIVAAVLSFAGSPLQWLIVGDAYEPVPAPAFFLFHLFESHWIVVSLVAVVMGAIAVLGVVGAQLLSPLNLTLWRPPGINSNFLRFSDPAHFFHFAAMCGAAAFAGKLAVTAVTTGSLDRLAVVCLMAAAGTFIGSKLCPVVWQRKYVGSPSASEG